MAGKEATAQEDEADAEGITGNLASSAINTITCLPIWQEGLLVLFEASLLALG